MKLYIRTLLVALIPMIFFFGYGFYQIKVILEHERKDIRDYSELMGEVAYAKVQKLSSDLKNTAYLLSHPKEISDAIKNNDTDLLYNESRYFQNKIISKIIFTDIDGIVLSRSHDEYFFGDNLSKHPAVKTAMDDHIFLGFTVIDGIDCLTYARPIKLYDNIQIGTLVIGIDINKKLLKSLTNDNTHIIVYKSPTIEIASEDYDYIQPATPIKLPISSRSMKAGFSLKSTKSQKVESLEKYQKNIISVTISLAVLLPLIIFVLLKSHLDPLVQLVDVMLDFAEKKTDLFSLNQKCLIIKKHNKHNDITKVAEAIVYMSDTINENIALLQKQQDELSKLSRTDRLTKIANRMHLEEMLRKNIAQSQRYKIPMSVIMFDIDFFKSVNDKHGHPTGDLVLQIFADLLQKNTRESDITGRWGGEEFLTVLFNSDKESAIAYANKIYRACANTRYPNKIKITCSVGVTSTDLPESAEELVNLSDKALYMAKHNGRNRVEYLDKTNI